MEKVCLLLFIIFVLKQAVLPQDEDVTLPNLDRQCLRCLCLVATGCNVTLGCIKGYCGPYKMSRVYWIDAGRIVMPEDDPERAGAFEDCAIHYYCARRVVVNYFVKYARDCNGDGVTDCQDYMMINFNGGIQCQTPMDRNEAGRGWLERYRSCDPKGRNDF